MIEPAASKSTQAQVDQSGTGVEEDAPNREQVDVVWANGTMVPKSAAGSIFTYRAGQIAANEKLNDPGKHGLKIKNDGILVGLDGEPIGFVYESLPNSAEEPKNTGPVVPDLLRKIEQAEKANKNLRVSVHHVCGLTPYYMISEGDPDPATKTDFDAYRKRFAESVGQLWPEPGIAEDAGEAAPEVNAQNPMPKLSIIDVGYVVDDKGAEVELDVVGGEFGALPAQNHGRIGAMGSDMPKLLERAIGHGSFVGSVAAMTADAGKFRFERARASDGVVDELAVCRQLVQAAEWGADVINLSLGCYAKDDQPPVLFEATLRHILEERRDLVVAAAAGNDRTRRVFWPAAFASPELVGEEKDWRNRIISVGALNGYHPADFANAGPTVQWYAPGTRVVGEYIGAPGKPALRQNVNDDALVAFYGYARWEGSSQAAPYVAGLILRRMKATGKGSAAEAWSELADLEPYDRRTISLLRADEV